MNHGEPIEPDEIIGENATTPERSLVALSRLAKPGGACPFRVRPDASFVAQLIAGAANVPQARALRRASPQDALASYRRADERGRAQASAMGKDTSLVA